MALVKSLNYNVNKPLASNGTPEILRFRSDNSTYNSGDIIRIEIPTGRQGMHLFPQDSYIEAQVTVNCTTNTAASYVYLDGSVYSFFRRLRVLHGSNVIEDSLYSNRLWNALYDMQRNASERKGDTINLLINPLNTATVTTASQFGLIGKQIATAVGTGNFPATPIDFTFVLPSSLLGLLAQKALPLSLCTASSIYLELELESASQVFIGSESTDLQSINSYTLSNIYYNAKIV